MKIVTNPSSILFAAEASIKAIDAERASRDAAAQIEYSKLGWFWRLFIPKPVPSSAFTEQRLTCLQLIAIAKHKRGAGVLEIEGRDLGAIALALEPWENPRI